MEDGELKRVLRSAPRPWGRALALTAALMLAPALLALGALVPLRGGGLRAADSSGAACAPLAEAEPVAVAVRGNGGGLHSATGYASREGQVMVPLRGLVEHTAPLYWDETGRTVSLLGPRDVLSVHFPEGRAETRLAVLNGEVITSLAVFCDGQVYLPAAWVSDVLQLELMRP